jgi:hypothetical protein
MIGFGVDSKKKVNGTGSCCQRFLEPTQLISPEKYRQEKDDLVCKKRMNKI